MFITNATVICSFVHGLCTFTVVPRSTQPCIPPGSLNRVPASAGVKARTSPLKNDFCLQHFSAINYYVAFERLLVNL